MQTIPFNEVKNNLIGQPGTDRRDAYEAKLAKETGPKMKGILFSTEMVRAILEDRKTQTRREIKHPGAIAALADNIKAEIVCESFAQYQPGDILYVREEHKVTLTHDLHGKLEGITCEYKDGSAQTWQPKQIPLDTLQRLIKRKTLGKWQRGRFLPKALARTFLRVTAVKAERLNDITEADAIAEGIELFPPNPQIERRKYMLYRNPANGATHDTAVKAFQSLWIGINGLESWAANPYVFAYTFERTDATHSIPQSFNPSIL